MDTISASKSKKISLALANTPLTPWVISLITGYLLAKQLPLSWYSWLILGLIPLFLAIRLKQKVFFLFTATFLSGTYFLLRNPPPLSKDNTPSREIIADMRIDSISSQDRYGRLKGLGTLVKTQKHVIELRGLPIYFHLSPSAISSEVLLPSAIVKVRGVFEPILNNDSFSSYLESSGIYFHLSRGKFLSVTSPPSHWQRFCQRQNQFLEHSLRFEEKKFLFCPFSTKTLANVYVAMTLGKKAVLSLSQKEAFSTSGTMHLFAISGLHVGIIALSLHGFFHFFRLNPSLNILCSLALLFLYVGITGASASALRAFLMIALFWGAKMVLRKPSPFSALVASTIGVLLFHPTGLWNIGLQLSYAATAAILLYGVPLNTLLQERLCPCCSLSPKDLPWHHRLWRKGCQALFSLFSVSFAATLASTPLTISHFGIFTPGSIPLNMMLAFLTSLVINMGLFSAISYTFHLSILSHLANQVSYFLLGIMDHMIRISIAIPGSFCHLQFRMSWLGPCGVLGILLGLWMGHRYGLAISRPFWFYTSIPLVLGALLITGTMFF